MTAPRRFTLRLFYSYSHKDSRHRVKMEQSLTLLRDQDGILEDWSDQQILPGQRISQKLQEKMKNTDIFVFLLSQDFIASPECQKEWSQARQIATKRPAILLVPIILSTCSWKDIAGMSDIKALPEDGKPIKTFQDKDIAWQQIYEGLKNLIDHLRQTFTLRDDFRKEMEKTTFLSQRHISLQRIFVFPRLSSYTTTPSSESTQKTIEDKEQLLQSKYTLIHGEELSGKTALCRHLFLSLVDDATPAIYLDLADATRRAAPHIFSEAYQRQYHGDYSLWAKQEGKVIILDNLSNQTIGHVTLAVKHFDRVIVTLPTDTFYAYYKDDNRLAEFKQVEILPLTHGKQEELIRKRTELSEQGTPPLDGHIDQIENQVNAIIINDRILPRYPFYVLSILQTYEGFMPSNLSVTSYGHCYYVLILAHLLKAGISKSDDEINACFNLSENLAFEIHRSGTGERPIGEEAVGRFIAKYKGTYLIKESTLTRLFDSDYGILSRTGQFRSPYMYYFFLGKFLARNGDRHKDIIERMCDESHITSNCLTLTFTIHHTNDEKILDDILLRTMCALDDMEPSVLDRKEAKIFDDIVAAIPPDILSRDSVETGRKKEREERDKREAGAVDELEEKGDVKTVHAVNDVYRIMKNSEILAQLLRNKYGSIERPKVIAIIETIADARLRLVRLMLGHQEEMNDLAIFIHRKSPTIGLDETKKVLRFISFVWTMHNVERAIGALNKPEIRPLVEEVVTQKDTPAYDLIGYFLRLDTIDNFSDNERRQLKDLLNKYQYDFFRKVVSIRTQRHLNTHRVHTRVEQAVCSLLNIKYKPRLKKLA